MKPEAYWIKRGGDVIGRDVLEDSNEARQAATYQAIAGAVRRYGPDVVLDIGCNTAVLAFWLDTAHYYGGYVGLDSNPHALKLASVIAPVIQGNLRALPYAAQAFDVVVVKDVIEHLEGLSPLREAFRVTRKALILACYIPFSYDHQTIEQHQDGYYINTYYWGEVRQFARRCGFGLVNTLRPQEANGTPNEITVWERVK